MPHTLPSLPYGFDALEPVIDTATMQIHHGKHHQAYVTNLNNAINGKPEWEGLSIEQLCASIEKVPADIRQAVRNNGGGHYNHSLFWTLMAPKDKGGGGHPTGPLADAIKSAFGSFDTFKTQFAEGGTKRFGSGWVWLGAADTGKLTICSTPNQDNPLMKGVSECICRPILGLDVWEHAYYLKYQNRRPDYITAWWDVVNWSAVAERFARK